MMGEGELVVNKGKVKKKRLKWIDTLKQRDNGMDQKIHSVKQRKYRHELNSIYCPFK